MLARLRGIAMWLVTAVDDVVVEKLWPRLRSGDVAGAVRVVADLILGFWGCVALIAVLALALAALVALR
jgi:hypothetical protein